MVKPNLPHIQINSLYFNLNKLLNTFNRARANMASSDIFVEDIVCKVSDLQENQLKTFQLKDEGKVLVVKQNNVITAIGSKCTHYGAPLVNGALGNGRIRCPWHGACFNISNGDIEDFPGLDSLPCYQVTIEGDNVKVKAKKSDLQANKRIKSMVKRCKTNAESIVVIGGGPAAAVCVETLRQENYGGEITMICKENCLPYDRVKLSKNMGLDIKTASFRDDKFYQEYDINVVKGVEATKVDPTKKTVTLRNGSILPYTKLFIATGNKPRYPCTPGWHLQNVLTLRTYEQANEANSLLTKDKEVVIVGSSFIAMEVADYLKDKVKKVTVLMRSDVPLKSVLGPRIGESVLKLLKKKGVNFIPNIKLDTINGTDKVESIKLHGGTIIPADIVIMGTGSNPNTSFLRDSSIQLEGDGTIETNEYLESKTKDVYVGGDIASAPVWSNSNIKTAIGHFGLAQYHGKIAALNMVGKKTELRTVPYFWTKIGPVNIRYSGHANYDDIVYNGNVEEYKFVAFYLKDNEVVAVSSSGMDPYVSKFAELVAQGKKLTRSDLSPDPLSWAQ